MFINKRKIETLVYELEDDFYVEVSPDIKDDEVIHFYLCHKSYGIKEMMFGVMKKDAGEMIEELIINNVDEYIKFYKEEYFDDYDPFDFEFDCDCDCCCECECGSDCDCDCHDDDELEDDE